jgi:hypothetical protein
MQQARYPNNLKEARTTTMAIGRVGMAGNTNSRLQEEDCRTAFSNHIHEEKDVAPGR